MQPKTIRQSIYQAIEEFICYKQRQELLALRGHVDIEDNWQQLLNWKSNNYMNYEQDFYAWLNHNALLLRQGQLAEIDALHLAEELEDMGKSQQRALTSRLAVLLMHLLKWQYQPARRSRSWELTLIEQRQEILELLEDSPSLKAELGTKLAKAYQRALIKAERETGIPNSQFPVSCPYSLEQVFNEHFYP